MLLREVANDCYTFDRQKITCIIADKNRSIDYFHADTSYRPQSGREIFKITINTKDNGASMNIIRALYWYICAFLINFKFPKSRGNKNFGNN